MNSSNATKIHYLSEVGIKVRFADKYYDSSGSWSTPMEPIVNKLKRLFKEL